MTTALGFEDWYEATRPTLVRSLLVVCGGDLDNACEAADEAMARTYGKWASVRTMDNPSAWTHRVAINLVKRRFRRAQTEDYAVGRLRPLEPTTTADADRSSEIALWEAVATLDRRSREVVALRYVLGLREAEIAKLLRTREGTVSSILSRARTNLRVRLADSHDPAAGDR